MMSSSNQIAEHGEAISQPGREHQSHDNLTSHVNSQASGSSHQMNGDINTINTINSPPYGGFASLHNQSRVVVQETITRRIEAGPGEHLAGQPLAPSNVLQDARSPSRNSAASSPPRPLVGVVPTGPFLAPLSTDSPKARFQEAVLRLLIDIGFFTIFYLAVYLICQMGSSTL
jgi:hypothetical protein